MQEVYMNHAYEIAKKAAEMGEVPVGAVIVDPFREMVVAEGHNLVISHHNPTAHAEMCALWKAGKELQSSYLVGLHMYVTLEPCPMCAQAIAFSRISKLIYAASDPKGGGVEHGPKIFESSSCHHKIEIEKGLMADRCGQLLKDFFKELRKNNKDET